MRLLIAEDSEIERLVLREAVEGLGHECLVAADGAEAWELFQHHEADVVITDWLMPRMQGPELCRRIRSHPGAPYTYLILLTALDDRESTLAGMAAGADDYLTKPLEIGDLEARLVAATRVIALHRQLSQHAIQRERTLARRDALLRLARQLAAESDPERLLSALLAESTALLGATAGLVSRWDEAQQTLVPVRSTIPGGGLGAGEPSLAREVSTHAAMRRSTVVLDDPAIADPFHLRAAAAAPLVYAARLLGTLAVATREPDTHFSVEDLDLLAQVADIAAAAIAGLDRARSEGALFAVRAMESFQPRWPSGGGAASGPPPPAGLRATLPAPGTPLVGREREVETVRLLVLRGDANLVTLTGPAGVGKTRLAVAVASSLLDAFEQRVVFVDLQTVRESTQVLAAIAHAFGARSVDDAEAWLLAELATMSSTLLVVDNFEHVLAVAPRLAWLLESCPRLTVLVTSREALRVRSEHAVPVLPLGLPDVSEPRLLASLARSPAVVLFVQRAQAADVGFSLTEANAGVVADVCARLDGLPLAIELAAARIRVLPPEVLRARLGQQALGLLSGGARDQPVRHQTLRGALAWSYDLLGPDEQRLFRQLGVFAGDFTLEAAAAVLTQSAQDEIVDAVSALVDKNLVVAEGRVQADGEARYRLLETIRQFALEQLTNADELPAALENHARFYVGLAERAEAGWAGPDQATWVERVEREHDNLQAAVRWAARHQASEVELRLCGALAWFWAARGFEGEGRELVEAALARARQRPPAEISGPPDRPTEATDGHPLALVVAEAAALAARARLAGLVGDWRTARKAYEERLALAGRDTTSLIGLALAHLRLGERGPARRLAAEGLAVAREHGDRAGQALALRLLGEIATERGDFAEATSLLEQSLSTWAELRDRYHLAGCLETCAAVAAARTHAARALLLAAAAAALRETIGTPLRGGERASLERWLTVARDRLGAEAALAIEDQGRALTPEQAIAEATAPIQPAVASLEVGQLGPLTDRQAEVAILVARGWSNSQIGAELHVSERTVEAHLRRMIHKLGFASRTQLAAWTAQQSGGRQEPGSSPPPDAGS